MIYFKKLLRDIADIYVNDETFFCDYVDEDATETRSDFVNGIKIVYEAAMQAFLSIIQTYGDIEQAMSFLMIYRDSFDTIIGGLRDTILETVPV